MSILNSQPMFFLGANSPKGFISKFGEAFSHSDGWHTYIIKGGPGTGKSTLMKRTADYFLRQGLRAHLCPCSSDPASLDAVIFPDIRVIILDGTAPHVVEPIYPGACEEIINMGDCWDASALRNNRKEIVALTNLNKSYHKKASNCLIAAGCMGEDISSYAAACTNTDKAYSFGMSLAKKYIPKLKAQGIEWQRFLSGVSPKGHIFYKKTLDKMCDEKIIVSDEYGAASPAIMDAVREYALTSGHEIISCRCPLRPEKVEHIILPSLRLCFCTSNKYHPVDSKERVIHARRFMDMKAFHLDRQRVNFSRKSEAEMITLAAESLMEAKAVHDDLEAYYISAMDRSALNSHTDYLIHKILETDIKQ